MRNYKLILILTIALYKEDFAQTPANDQNWNLIFNEEFNTRPAGPTWSIDNLMNHNNEPQIATNRVDNVFVGSGILTLRTKKESFVYNGETFNYTAGEIRTINTFKYGFFEAKVLCPSGKGYWPAFWLHTGATIYCNYNEIDVFENDGGNSYFYSNNVWYQTPTNCIQNSTTQHPFMNKANSFLISDTWHLWGLEWAPDKLIFYLDGKEIRRVYTQYVTDFLPIIIGQGLYRYDDAENRGPDSTTPLNGDFKIDYVKVYKKMFNCSQNTTINDFSTYTYNVKKNIIVGDGTNSIAVPASSAVMLMATDGITISNNFTVPLGSEFGAFNTVCE
jgi:beta-glucanase (GH16 family)